MWRFNKLFHFKKLDFSYVRLYVVKLFEHWIGDTWLWNVISSSFVWESSINHESVSLARSSCFWRGFVGTDCFSSSAVICIHSLCVSFKSGCCSGPFIVCCLLYQFLLVPSGPRVFSLSAFGRLLKLNPCCAGAGECVWRMVCKMLCGSQRMRLGLKPQTPNWLFSEDGWRERRGSCKDPWIKNKGEFLQSFTCSQRSCTANSCLLVASLVFIMHMQMYIRVFAVFVRSGQCVEWRKRSCWDEAGWLIKTCISVTRFMTINNAKTVFISLWMTLNYFQSKYLWIGQY